MRYRVSSTLSYQISQPATFVLNVAAAGTARQRVEEEQLSLSPELARDSHRDPESANRYHRIASGPGELAIRYRATVESEPLYEDPAEVQAVRPDRLPLELLPYLLPSRYCQSDQLMRLAYREFGRYRPGYEQVRAICDWIHDNVDYLAGATGSMTSAFDTATARAGVCRDFAHLGIACCRAVNIPARFVSGYAYELEPPDFHAVFEAWLGGRWYLFDATRRVHPAGMVRIGTGRDAGDVSFALIFGPAQLSYLEVVTEAVDERARTQPRDTMHLAVATA